jgi:hypothetical protein
MDPNACLTRFLDALRDADRDEAQHAAEDLARWIRQGGFLPDDPRPQPPAPPAAEKVTPIAKAMAEHVAWVASANPPGEPFSSNPDDLAAAVEELTDEVEVTPKQILENLSAAVALLKAGKHPKAQAHADQHDQVIIWTNL